MIIFFSYNSNGYVVSPTIITPTGQYYQLGLPPLHGHQPVYHIPPSPTHLYETETYSGQTSVSPMSPMSPLFQPPVYYSHPVLISPTTMSYPMANTMYENPQCNMSGVPVEIAETNKNGPVPDPNNNPNNNPAIHVNNNLVTTMVPTSSEINASQQQQQQQHQQQSYLPVVSGIPTAPTTGTQNTFVVNNAYNQQQQQQPRSTDICSIVVNRKPSPMNSNVVGAGVTTAHSHPPSSVYSSLATGVNNNLSMMNGGVSSSHGGNIHLMNNNNIIHSIHPHLIAGSHVMSGHNVSATTFVTSPLPSPSMQGPNQTQMFHMPPPHHYVTQQREVVTHRV